VPALQAAIAAEMQQPADRAATRLYAEQFSWDETAHKIYALAQQLSQPHA